MIYLSSPYTDPNQAVMNIRYHAVLRATGRYLRQGHPIYSPIVHCHNLPGMEALRGDLSFWLPLCLKMLDAADSLWVLMLKDWEKSKGVQAETAFAQEHNIPIEFKEPPDG